MKAVILAAGYATRLYPLTENFPKPLLPVGGRPILDWLVSDLADSVEEFALVTNHRFADHFASWAAGRPERIRIVDDGTETNETRLGAVRDMLLAVETAGGEDDWVALAGDNVLDFSLVPFLTYSAKVGASCVMCHEERDVEKLRRTAVITVDGDQRITSYEEKPREPRGHLAVPPFYCYRGCDIRRIPEALVAGCGADAPGSFAAWLSRQTTMYAWPMPGRRHDVGDLRSYEAIKDSYQGLN